MTIRIHNRVAGVMRDKERNNDEASHNSEMVQIKNLMRARRNEEAELRLREICAKADADAESWFLLGVLSGMRGDAVGAESGFRRALALKTDFVQARYNLGIALRNLGRHAEARAELESVISAQPNHADAFNALGIVYVRLELLSDAERAFRAALALNPTSPDSMIYLANVLSLRQQWSQAEAFYRRVLAITPARSDVALNLGTALASQGRVEEAIGAYRSAIAASPALVEAHVQLGISLKRLEKKHEAENAFREALRLNPDHPVAQFFLASLRGSNVPACAPAEYIARFYNDYAETFEANLVERLQYQGPSVLLGAAQAALVERDGPLDVLELGCGTGLCGPLFRPMARSLIGVDLSPKMLAMARARQVYDDLEVGELTAALRKRRGAVDLAIAADVFIYIGDLAPVFEAAAGALRPRGLFAFSVEAATAEEGESYILRNTARYAHTRTYVEGLARRFGFEHVSCEEFCIRMELGQPIAGMIHVLRLG